MSKPVTVPFSQKLFVHIGPHKTGSTAIQKFLYERDQDVLARGVLYPEAGRHPEFPNQHWLFGDAVARGNEAYLDQFASELTAEIEAKDPQVVLLSTETLARQGIGVEHFQRVLTMFPEADLEWVLLLRNPLALAKSRYSEQTRQGELRFPHTIADIVSPRILGQLERLQNLARASQSAPIRLASFEQVKSGLVEHFLQMLDLEACFDPSWQDASTHESLPPGAIELFRYVNLLPGRLARPLRTRITRLAWRHGARFPKVKLDTGRLETALEPFYADCRAMEALFFHGEDTGLVPQGALRRDVSGIVAANTELKSRVRAYRPR